jgi:hypothetical protein
MGVALLRNLMRRSAMRIVVLALLAASAAAGCKEKGACVDLGANESCVNDVTRRECEGEGDRRWLTSSFKPGETCDQQRFRPCEGERSPRRFAVFCR